jgi:hypothetical protein
MVVRRSALVSLFLSAQNTLHARIAAFLAARQNTLALNGVAGAVSTEAAPGMFREDPSMGDDSRPSLPSTWAPAAGA